MAADAVRRRSRRLTWGRARRFVQALSLLVFFLLFLGASRQAIAPSLVDLPFRLDPLTMLAQTLASRRLLATSALALLTLAFTLVLGRAWCGWLCPLGTLLDVFTPRRPETVLRAPRTLACREVPAAARRAGSGAVRQPHAADPRPIDARLPRPCVQPVAGPRPGGHGLERAAYRFEVLRPAVNWLEGVLRPNIFPLSPVHAGAGIAIFLVLAAILALNWLAPRFWCRSLCPLGGLLALVSKAAIVRRHVDPACTGCAVCARKCPTGTIRADRGFASDPAECTVCMDCVDACAKGTNAFRAGSPRPSLGRLRSEPSPGPGDDRCFDPGCRAPVHRSPARSRAFPSAAPAGCRRCRVPEGLHPLRCMCARLPHCGAEPSRDGCGVGGRVVSGAHPASRILRLLLQRLRSGLPGAGDPAADARGQASQVIGVAYIDQNRCIAWADHTDCIVCEEMCPVPEKAITLEPATVPGANGAEVQVKLPRVDRVRCIGCGICEYKCPVAGEAAIRVYTTATTWL